MKASIQAALLLASCSFTANILCAQTTRAFNQNASRSNHTRLMASDGWTLAASGGTSFATNNNENSSFRGSGIAGKLSANYYFNKIGLGISSGILTGSVNDNALNRFITERKFPVNQIQVSKSNPYNGYFLAGPTVRFGNLVTILAEVKGGVFVNNPGSVNINQTGLTRPLYRFEAGEKNLSPGFSGSINIAYPLNNSTQFFINTDYLQSRSSVRLLDPSAGIDVPTQMNRDMKLVTAGIGIIKTFAGNHEATVAKKHIGNVKYEEIAARESGSGRPSGRRDAPAENDALTGNDQIPPMSPNCGPVTQRTYNSDGSTSEIIFACPDDAAAYNNRISMNVTTPKQTQGATFGEKVNAGLHAAGSALSQGARSGSPEVLKAISIEADMDGDGQYETDATAIINDEISINEKGEIMPPQQKAGVSTSRSNIRSHYSLQPVNDKLYIGLGNAEINGKTVPVKVVYKATSGLKDTLKTQV